MDWCRCGYSYEIRGIRTVQRHYSFPAVDSKVSDFWKELDSVYPTINEPESFRSYLTIERKS